MENHLLRALGFLEGAKEAVRDAHRAAEEARAAAQWPPRRFHFPAGDEDWCISDPGGLARWYITTQIADLQRRIETLLDSAGGSR